MTRAPRWTWLDRAIIAATTVAVSILTILQVQA